MCICTYMDTQFSILFKACMPIYILTLRSLLLYYTLKTNKILHNNLITVILVLSHQNIM